MHVFALLCLFTHIIYCCASGISSEEDEASFDSASDSECVSALSKNGGRKKVKRPLLKKRKVAENDVVVDKPTGRIAKATAKRKEKQEVNSGGKTTFSIESVLDSFKDTTEYGATFRSMTIDAQKMEVVRLNKGATTGMKGAIRKQRIDVQFKSLVSEKMKSYLIANRTDQKNMFRTITQPRILQKLQLNFLPIGEWVEVDANRTPGWNSEGGIAVIVGVNDGLADVK
jgi:hypothetical protein